VPVKIDSVMTDHATGMRQAVDYLIGLGHRRIALITAGTDIFPAASGSAVSSRPSEARTALPRRPDPRAHPSTAYWPSARQHALTHRRPADGDHCRRQQILVGVLRAVQQRGLEIGRDLSLITCDH
jgi:LacI family transcriptional regulator